MSKTPGHWPLKVTKVDDFFTVTTNQGNHYAKTFDPFAAHLISLARVALIRAPLVFVADSFLVWIAYMMF